MISAFGERAGRYAQRLGDIEAIVTDPGGVSAARDDAAKRRESGEPFYGMVLFDEPRVAFSYRHVEAILAQIPDYDRRRLMMDQLLFGALPINQKRSDELWQPNPAAITCAAEFLAQCDAVLVRSFAELGRIRQWFRATVPSMMLPPVDRVFADAVVPVVDRVRPERPCVVVWAPDRPAIETALHLHGLAEFHGDVTCISLGGQEPSRTRAEFLGAADPRVETVLSRAAAIVCVDPCDPASAVAFARLGYGVVAPSTSGAHEFAGEVVPWDPLDARFLSTAVAVAVTRPASVRCEPSRPPRAPKRPAVKDLARFADDIQV